MSVPSRTRDLVDVVRRAADAAQAEVTGRARSAWSTLASAAGLGDARVATTDPPAPEPIDPLRAMEAGLLEHRALLESVFDVVESQVFVKDLDGRYVVANQQIEIESGVPHDEMIGRTDRELFPDADVDTWRANDLAVIEGGEAVRVEEQFERPDGMQTFLSMKFPLLDDDGRPYALAGISTNITDRKRAEVAVVEANRAKTDFLSRMSHELRTPLNAVIGFAQLLAKDDLDDDQRESVEQVLNGAEHLLGLINEVLDISSIESGTLSLSIEAVDIESVVTEAVELMAALAAGRRLTLDVHPPPGVRELLAWADRQRVRQVLLNLLSNAVKYTPPGGSIRVSWAPRDDGAIVIEVDDTGPGIAPGDLDRVFAPFERLGKEAGATEGTGIGLALTKGLVEQMGGVIGVRTELGAGTTFTVVLRDARAVGATNLRPAPAPASRPRVPARATPAGANARGLVLYIEDELANLRLVERILAATERFELISAGTGELGIELAAVRRPAVILLDLHLPDLHGSEVMQQLRVDERTREIPVVIISADATEAQQQRSLARGARAFVTKPIDVDELVAVLDDTLARTTIR
jgi:PAS domain S-box-containing protein